MDGEPVNPLIKPMPARVDLC